MIRRGSALLPRKSRLRLVGQLRDLVQEQRARIADLRRQESPRVDDEGIVATAGRGVNRPRHEFAAGPRFAGHQHRRIRQSDGGDLLEDILHRPRRTHQSRGAAQLGAQSRNLLLELRALEGALDQHGNLLRAQRLHQIVERALLHRLDGVIEGAVGGDDHDRFAGQTVERLQAVHTGQADVQEDQIGGIRLG